MERSTMAFSKESLKADSYPRPPKRLSKLQNRIASISVPIPSATAPSAAIGYQPITISSSSLPTMKEFMYKNNLHCANQLTFPNLKPQCVSNYSFVNSMAELVHDAIPQTTVHNERIQWVSAQKVPNADDEKRVVDLIIISFIGGYKIYMYQEDGVIVEVISETTGTIKMGRILDPTVEPFRNSRTDKFIAVKPLLALVEDSAVDSQKSCVLSFLSLKTSQYVHQLIFVDEIISFNSSKKILVVSFANYIKVCDVISLTEQFCLYNCQISDSIPVPLDVSDSFVAYAASSLDELNQSCGGLVMDIEESSQSSESAYNSYTYGLFNVAKKTVSALGDTMAAYYSPGLSFSANSLANPGIVTVMDVDETVDGSSRILAHFVAHDEPISFIAFSNGGRLLLTAGQSSTNFYLFRLSPHPLSSVLGAVRHLYTLRRGTLPAKVLNCSFSIDNRWLLITTNHGTAHVFAICEEGGVPTLNTHKNYSRGLEMSETGADMRCAVIDSSVSQSSNIVRERMLIYKHHPSIANEPMIKSVSNLRIGPNFKPIQLFALCKLGQKFLSVENLSARASDLTPNYFSYGRKNVKTHERTRIFASFSSNPVTQSHYPSILVVDSDGKVFEYVLECNEDLSDPKNSSKSIQCISKPRLYWTLDKTKFRASLKLPIAESNPLWLWLQRSSNGVSVNKDYDAAEKWTREVEVVTYYEPAKRAWMGPQSKLMEVIACDHSSTDLVAPGNYDSVDSISGEKFVPVNVKDGGLARLFIHLQTRQIGTCELDSYIPDIRSELNILDPVENSFDDDECGNETNISLASSDGLRHKSGSDLCLDSVDTDSMSDA